MKKIKLDGKLTLNKKVVSQLNRQEMKAIRGGAENSKHGCKTRLNCDHTNRYSWGYWCTADAGCLAGTIKTKGIFCVDHD